MFQAFICGARGLFSKRRIGGSTIVVKGLTGEFCVGRESDCGSPFTHVPPSPMSDRWTRSHTATLKRN